LVIVCCIVIPSKAEESYMSYSCWKTS